MKRLLLYWTLALVMALSGFSVAQSATKKDTGFGSATDGSHGEGRAREN
jgi:hypothetical protein